MSKSYSADFIEQYPKQLQTEIATMEKKKDEVIAEYKRLKLGLSVKTSYEELDKVKGQIEETKAEVAKVREHLVTSAKVEAQVIIEKAHEVSNKIISVANGIKKQSEDRMAEAEARIRSANEAEKKVNDDTRSLNNHLGEIVQKEKTMRDFIEKTITSLRNL